MAFTDKQREREYKREWQRAQGPGYRAEYKRAWFAARPDYLKEWHQLHPDAKREYAKRWAETNPEKAAAYKRAKWRRRGMRRDDSLKITVLTHYGHGRLACVTCQAADPDVLVLDHINDDGFIERKQTKSFKGRNMYRLLKARGLPEGYQTLCANCNLKKHRLHTRGLALQRPLTSRAK